MARWTMTGLRRIVLLLGLLALPAVAGPATGQAAGPALSVDVAADRHPISRDIYGMNFADPTLASELRLGVDRWGGNASTRYNWQTGLWNTAADWYYENYPAADLQAMIAADRAAGTSTFLSVNTLGWVAKPGSPSDHPLACGFKVSKYGAQQSTDPWDADCGNGKRTTGSFVTGNDPLDTSVAVGGPFIGTWVSDLVSRYGSAAAGGVRIYGLDNEPVLWSETHRDVHPAPTTYDELRDKDTAVAAAIKAADPTAQVAGPSDWGWSAYFDTLAPGDKAAHGNVALAPWFLQQMKAYADSHGGQRILDYFDEHYYPQADGVTLGPAGNSTVQARRLRSTRSLWDPTYLDESWIGSCCNGHVMLIPRMRAWIDANYPGTKLAIGEYNWGGLESVNGALAQADALGIFARENVDMAMLWAPPTPAQPVAYAFRMYRNYDGAGGSFGDTWVRSTSTDQSQLAVYGAQRTIDGALTVMVVNKTSSDLASTLSLSHFRPQRTAQVYRYSGASPSTIQHPADLTVSPGGLTATYPANSITLLVLPPETRVGDFDGNGTSDVAVYRPSTGGWFVRGGAPAFTSWGTTGDLPVAGDYDGDGDTDKAVFRPSNGVWLVAGGATAAFGTNGDVPVPGDYDGNDDTDMAVFRPSSGVWFVRGGTTAAWGTAGDIPVPADYNGDGDTDMAVFRPSAGVWFVEGGATVNWGTNGDVPVPGDYDGDGDTDMAVFRPSSGVWFVRGGTTTAYGTAGDIPVPGDYDGDGDTDMAVFRPSNGVWFVPDGPGVVVWGTADDFPAPLPEAVRRAVFPSS